MMSCPPLGRIGSRKTPNEDGAVVILGLMHGCDTTTPHGVLMLKVLGGLAEFERPLIKARTGEARERATGCAVRTTARAVPSTAPRPSRGSMPVMPLYR
jgi:Resolvase, N terminal domain